MVKVQMYMGFLAAAAMVFLVSLAPVHRNGGST